MPDADDTSASEYGFLARIRWFKAARAQQNALYQTVGTQNLTWDVILLIAEAQYASRDLNVSDICVSVPASKSTTLKLIARLAADKVISKHRKPGDSRTQLIRLRDKFRADLETALNALVDGFPNPQKGIPPN